MQAEFRERDGHRTTFGVGYDLTTFAELLDRVSAAVVADRRLLIGYLNLHGAHLCRRSADMQAFMRQADCIYADGFPLYLWRRLLWRDAGRHNLFTLTRRLPALLQHCADRDWPVYYLGSRPEKLEAGLRAVRAMVPSLQITGKSGFFDQDPMGPACRAVVDDINASGARVLLVGMGMPVQERWILSVQRNLQVPVVWACGGAIEYYGGDTPIAPRWMRESGLEWAFRLRHDPARLAFRYLAEPALLAPAIIGDIGRRLRHGWS